MHIIEYFGLSARRAYLLIGICRTSFSYKPKKKKPDEAAIRLRLKELADKRKRFGAAQGFMCFYAEKAL